ncbi:MAG: ABC transporter permease subunit [Coprococcus phoceensis]
MSLLWTSTEDALVCMFDRSSCISAIVGGISGLLKAYFNVNEVISCIMLNWIGLYSVNMLLTKVKDASTPYTKPLSSTNKSALLPNAGLDKLFANNEFVTIGLVLSVVMAIVVWVILEKTKFGYELKATGLNKNAAKYCGMREKKKYYFNNGNCRRTCRTWCWNLLSDWN